MNFKWERICKEFAMTYAGKFLETLRKIPMTLSQNFRCTCGGWIQETSRFRCRPIQLHKFDYWSRL